MPRLIIKSATTHLIACTLLALIAVFFLRWLWDYLALPNAAPAGLWGCVQPWGLRHLAFLTLPGIALGSSLCLELLLWLRPASRQEELSRVAARARSCDLASYALLFSCALAAWLWGRPGGSMLPLASAVVALLAAKAAVLLWLLWRVWLASAHITGWRQQAAVFLAVFTILAGTGLWVKQVSSTAGDEVSYLLMAHSLARHGTLDQRATLDSREYREFYHCRWSDDLQWALAHSHSYFPFFLTPAYALGGRTGVMLFLAAIMAMMAGQLHGWLRQSGQAPGVAALSVGLVILCAPVLSLGQNALSEGPGMLLLVLGLRLMPTVPRRPLMAGLGLLAITLCMYLLKFRLAALGGGLVLVTAFWWLRDRTSLRLALLAVSGGVGLTLLAILLALAGAGPHPYSWESASFQDELRQGLSMWARCDHFWTPLWVMFGGMFLDQSFGLLLTAPVILLAVPGIPAALRRFPRPAITALTPVVVYVGMVCLMRWYRWQGGFDLPARLYLVAFPALALFLGVTLSALARPWWRLVAWAIALWGLTYTLVMVIVPALRWGRSGMINPAVSLLQKKLGLDFYHLLPSTFVYSPLLPWYAVLAVMGLLVLAWQSWRNASPDQSGDWRLRAREVVVLVLGLALLASAPLMGAKLWPPRVLEAELMHGGRRAPLWAENAFPWEMHGRSVSNEGIIWGRLFFPGGPVRLRLVARAGSPGVVVLRLDGWPLPGLAFDQGRTLQTGLLMVKKGWHRVSLVWRSCAQRDCYLLVDRLELLPGDQG